MRKRKITGDGALKAIHQVVNKANMIFVVAVVGESYTAFKTGDDADLAVAMVELMRQEPQICNPLLLVNNHINEESYRNAKN